MSFQPVKGGAIRYVKPVLSTSNNEARRRVINLYKAWYRQIPEIVVWFRLPVTIKEAKSKLKSEFMKHKDLKDIRIIDMLVVKGQIELKEVVNKWKQTCHIMYKFKPTELPKPKTFLSKFLSGSD